jgi:hypothetical protein
MTDHKKLTLSENFTPNEGLVPEFPLIPVEGAATILGLRTGIVSLHPIGNIGGLLPAGLSVRFTPPGHTSSSLLYNTTKADAVALAQAILCFFAPNLLVTNPPTVTQAPSPPPTPPRPSNPMGQLEPGPYRMSLLRAESLPGGYVNVVLGKGAPAICFGDSSTALKEAHRLAETTAPTGTVITARIEHVHKSEVKIHTYGVK